MERQSQDCLLTETRDHCSSGCQKKNKKRHSKRSQSFNNLLDTTQNEKNNPISISSGLHSHKYTHMPMMCVVKPFSLPAVYHLYQPVPLTSTEPKFSKLQVHCDRNHSNDTHSYKLNDSSHKSTSHKDHGTISPLYILRQIEECDTCSLSCSRKDEDVVHESENSDHKKYTESELGSKDPSHTESSEELDSIDTNSSMSIDNNSELVLTLIEQIKELKKSNVQLLQEINQNKIDIEIIKLKLIQYKNDIMSDNQSGILSDLITEIRETNKTCEDRLFNQMKSMLEDEENNRATEIDQLKNQMVELIKGKEKSDKRIEKLEEEITTMKLNANNEGREIAAFEEETLALRRELQEARVSRTSNIDCQASENIKTSFNFDSAPRIITTSTPMHTEIFSDTLVSVATVSTHTNENLTKRSVQVLSDRHPWFDNRIPPRISRSSSSLPSTNYNDNESYKNLRTIKSLPSNFEHTQNHFKRMNRITRYSENGLIEIMPENKEEEEEEQVNLKEKKVNRKLAFTENDIIRKNDSKNEIVESKNNKNNEIPVKEKILQIVKNDSHSLEKDDKVSNGYYLKRILTSRVLTAPSRATYTTAYI